MKRYLVVFLVISMLLGFGVAYAISFSDLDANHWAYQYITELAEKKVINL